MRVFQKKKISFLLHYKLKRALERKTLSLKSLINIL